MKKTLTAIAASLLVTLTAQADLKRFYSGNSEDVRPRLHGPAFNLAGGGHDVDAASQWMIDTVRGCTDCDTKLDVVVLRASGADGYNPFFSDLKGVNSVLTIVITDRTSSDRPDVVDAVRHSEIVFFAGGDQCNYVRFFKGTKLDRAVKALVRRGGGVGGSSAGMAIQSDVIYDSCPDQSAKSVDVLKDPYSIDVSLSRNFFLWPHMDRTITDTHFKQRDRMGRLMVFLARSIKDAGAPFLGVAASEGTSIAVDRTGKAYVLGAGPAYLVLADHQPEVVQKGTLLTYRGFKIWRFDAGQNFDLAHWPKSGYKTIDVINGVLSDDPY